MVDLRNGFRQYHEIGEALKCKFLGTFLGDAFQRKLVLLFDEILLRYGANFFLKNCWWLD